MRQTPTRSLPARVARGFFAAGALVLISLALVGTVKAELVRKDAQADARRLRDYVTLNRLSGTEGQRLANGGVAAARGQGFAADVKRTTNALRRLQAQADGSEASALTKLQVRWATALRRAVSGGDIAPLESALAVLQVDSTNKLHTIELSERQAKGSAPLETIGLAAIAALVLANLLWLLRLGLVSLRTPGEWDGRDRRVEELEAQAHTDSLTQLGNHRAFHADLSATLQHRARTGSHFTLMAVDLDGLKQINDTKGHPAGDGHIKRVTRCLRTVIGPAGTIYRTGGDEFMVILPNKRNWDALLLANQIDQATRPLLGRRAVSIGLTESTGLEGRQLLVHQADLALYEAKRTKLRAVTYHPGLAGGQPNQVAGRGPSRDQRALAAALARAVDAKDNGTRSHAELVAELCVGVGRRLGIAGDRLERLRVAGLLHDVGKIGVADSILQKKEPLNEDERLAMAEHVQIGHAILISAELPAEADWILQHHERYDGSGYPAGRHGEEIAIEARIISAADAFEAMTGPRPYRASISTDAALTELRRAAGTQFDARCVEALTAVVQNSPELVDELPPPTALVKRSRAKGELARQAS